MSARSKEDRAAYYQRNLDRERLRQREWQRKWRENYPEKVRAARKRLADARRAATAAKRAATAEDKAKILVERRERLNARRRELAALPENKERMSAKYLRCNQSRRSDPIHNIRDRIATCLRQSLTLGKKRAGTFQILGYTKEELAAHIERQFLPKMGWHNISKWHIDHIIPLAAFKYQSADDPAFKAAWALTNLRPVWARVNLQKNARREFLL